MSKADWIFLGVAGLVVAVGGVFVFRRVATPVELRAPTPDNSMPVLGPYQQPGTLGPAASNNTQRDIQQGLQTGTAIAGQLLGIGGSIFNAFGGGGDSSDGSVDPSSYGGDGSGFTDGGGFGDTGSDASGADA